jgi:hypothetical protein
MYAHHLAVAVVVSRGFIGIPDRTLRDHEKAPAFTGAFVLLGSLKPQCRLASG